MTGPPRSSRPGAPGRAAFSRRTFLRLAALTVAGLATPLAWTRRAAARLRGRFFTAPELATLAALCDTILPPDHDPGAAELGAPAYIERLLLALETRRPWIFAGGPYSGRQPFPDLRDGTASKRRPPNHFRFPIPPSRLQRLYWSAQILGAEAAGLPPHLTAQRGGVLRGLQEIYREGLALLDAAARERLGRDFAVLGPAERAQLVATLDRSRTFPIDPVRRLHFLDLAIQHTLEGCFAAPEYGGNRGGAGWRMLGIEGDSQPLGYSLFSRETGSYHERPDHPMSTPNPDEVGPDGSLLPRPLSSDGRAIQASISQLTGLLESLIPGACG